MKKKANELLDFYYGLCGGTSSEEIRLKEAKKCAFKLIDEVIDSSNGLFDDIGTQEQLINYWEQIRNEIKQTT